MTELETKKGLRKNSKLNDFKTEIIKNRELFLMILPAVLLVIIFNYIPMGGVIVAFKNYKLNLGILKSPWVGFKNFEYFLTSGKLWSLTINTLGYNIAFIITGTIVKMVIAILIYEMGTKYYKRTLQSIMMFPNFLSWVIIGGMAYNLFNYEFGTINNLLSSVGMEKIDIYGNPGIWKYIFIFASIWHDTGYGMIFYLAALTGIDPEYYEAAYLDGAGFVKRIIHITIPLIMPTTLVLLLLSLGGVLKGNLDMFYQLVGDNPNLYGATDVIDTYVFRTLATSKDYTVTSAAGLYQNVIGCLFVLIVNAVVKRFDEDSAIF